MQLVCAHRIHSGTATSTFSANGDLPWREEHRKKVIQERRTTVIVLSSLQHLLLVRVIKQLTTLYASETTMGNTGSASRESSLTTWAMAQYTSLNREQLMDLRDACFHEQKAKRKRRWRRKQNPFENKENEEESSMTSIESDKSSRTSDNKEDSVHVLSRARLKQCLETAGIQPTPDREIICDLHTMWDEHDTDEIPTMAFLVSLCPLACHPTHTSRMFFQFVMDFHDRKETRRLSPCDLMTILESKFASSETQYTSKVMSLSWPYHESTCS